MHRFYLATSVCIPKCILASAPTTNEIIYACHIEKNRPIIFSVVRLMSCQINLESRNPILVSLDTITHNKNDA